MGNGKVADDLCPVPTIDTPVSSSNLIVPLNYRVLGLNTFALYCFSFVLQPIPIEDILSFHRSHALCPYPKPYMIVGARSKL